MKKLNIQRYLKLLEIYVEDGNIPKYLEQLREQHPFESGDDPLMDYLVRLLENGKIRQLIGTSRLKKKVFYSSAGRFITECVHQLKFQNQRAWTEHHNIERMMEWSDEKRQMEWRSVLQQVDEKHRNDGFDTTFLQQMFGSADGATKQENWDRLAFDWEKALQYNHHKKEKDFIGMKSVNFETGLFKTLDTVQHHVEKEKISEEQALQAWDMMDGRWTQTEFEKQLKLVRIQDHYPELEEVVEKMGRFADNAGKERMAIASGKSLKMEHSSGSDIEGVTVGDDLNSLLPIELAQYIDEAMEDLFIYKYRTRRLQTFRYKSESSKQARRLGFAHATRKGPMVVCVDTSASMYGAPQRITTSLLSLMEETAELTKRNLFMIDFSVTTRPIDLMQRRKEKRLIKLGLTKDDYNFERGHVPFIGGGTDSRNMLEQLFELLDEEGGHYVNADVLWVTDFMIPIPQDAYLQRLQSYRDTGTKFYGMRIMPSTEKETYTDWQKYFDHIYRLTYQIVRRY